MATVADNLSFINKRIAEACSRAGRDRSEVKLVGVTKTVPVSRIREGIEAGLKILGENYIQEARLKMEELAGLDVSWHFIGHLQSNKAKIAVESFDCIHTVDRESLAKELDRLAGKIGRELPVLIEVNIGEEETKSGADPRGLFSLYKQMQSMDGLIVRGLMILPPYLDDPEEVRPYFRALRELLGKLKDMSQTPEELRELSMGMSHDYEAAIEEGATMVRIGTALFGQRPLKGK